MLTVSTGYLTASARFIVSSTKLRRFPLSQFVSPLIPAAPRTLSGFQRTIFASHGLQSLSQRLKLRNEEPKKGQRVLYFSNLPWGTQAEQLQGFGERFGTVDRVIMSRDHTGRFAGFANVIFFRPEDAAACLEHIKVNKFILDGRKSFVSLRAKPSEVQLFFDGGKSRLGRMSEQHKGSGLLFVGNIPWEAREKDVRQVLAPYGHLMRVTMSINSNLDEGRHRGFAHVEFSNSKEALQVVQSHRHDPVKIHGRPLILDYTEPLGEQANRRLFFRLLGETSESEMRELLREHGITMNFLLPARNGQSTARVGFLYFKTVEEATAMLELLRNTSRGRFHIEYGQLNNTI